MAAFRSDGDCTPHTKLYSQVTQTTFFWTRLVCKPKRNLALRTVAGTLFKACPGNYQCVMLSKAVFKNPGDKVSRFSSGLNTCLLSRLIWGWVKHVKVFQGPLYDYYVWWFHNWINSMFFLECLLLSKPRQLDADRQSDYSWRDRLGQSWDWNLSSWHQWPHVMSAALRLESRWPWLQAWRGLTTTLLSMDQHGSEHCPVAWDYATEPAFTRLKGSKWFQCESSI